MDFLEIELREMKESFSMPEPQFHEYYEFYFLLEGSRDVFIENKMYTVGANTLCVIPPFFMHRIEGTKYKRINLYISKNLMRESDLKFLDCYANEFAFSLSVKQSDFITDLLLEAVSLQQSKTFEQRKALLLPYVYTIFSYLQTKPLQPINVIQTRLENKKTNPTILKIISYINENYAQNITLKHLSEKFYISTNTLCKRFQQAMQCSVIEYATMAKLSKAKMYLAQSPNKNIEEISMLCGFSSANYFSLIFKKHFGISPLNWRKKK